MAGIDYTITWVRHGESIAQLIEHANDDYPFLLMDLNNTKEDESSKFYSKDRLNLISNADIDYEKEFNQYRKRVIEKEIENYDRFKGLLKKIYSDPNRNKDEEMTDYSKFNNKKLLDFEVFFPDNEANRYINLQDNAVLQSQVPNQVTNVWHLNTVFSKQISPSSWYFTPTLDSVGIMEAKKFGRDFLDYNINTYDAIICSPTVRTIMTALYALEAAEISGKQIIIIPYINEKNITNKGIEERANIGIPAGIIDWVINIIKHHIKKDLPRTHSRINIDTSFYQTEAGNNTGDNNTTSYLFSNREKGKLFIEENIIQKESKNVLAFVHGYTIKDLAQECNGGKSSPLFKLPTPFPYNCCAYEINYNTQNSKGLNIKEKYVREQTQIRSPGSSKNKYPDINDDDLINVTENYGSLAPDHLRGEINDLWILNIKPWYATKSSKGGKKRKTKRHRTTNKSRLFTLKKGDLTKYGYHANLSKPARHKALKKARTQYQPLSLSRKLNAVYVLNKNRDKKRAAIFKQDAIWVKNSF